MTWTVSPRYSPRRSLAITRRVDLAGRDVGRPDQVGVEEALVVPDVEVGLGAVLGDEDLAVLERVHRPGIDVEVRVQLLHRDPQSAGLQQRAEARGGQALAERGGDAAGDEKMACLLGSGGGGPAAGPRKFTRTRRSDGRPTQHGAARRAHRRRQRRRRRRRRRLPRSSTAAVRRTSSALSSPLACIWRISRARAYDVGANGAAAPTHDGRELPGRREHRRVLREPHGVELVTAAQQRGEGAGDVGQALPDEAGEGGHRLWRRGQVHGSDRSVRCAVVR